MSLWRAVLDDKMVLEDGTNRVSDIPLKRLKVFSFGSLVVEWGENMTDLTVGFKNYMRMPGGQRKRIPMLGYKINGEQLWFSLRPEAIVVSPER